MDDDQYDPEVNQVAAAQAQLELARRSGEVGSIALAHLNLGAILAALGDHQGAVEEYESLLSYIELAASDEEREVQRKLRMLSPSAPPAGSADVDLDTVSTVARITLAESLLALGRRDEARTQLDRAAPGTRGFGRGTMRKRLAAVRRRMDAASDPQAANYSTGDTESSDSTASSPMGPAEQVAAADELLGQGRFSDAARIALGAIGRCGDDDRHLRAQARQVLGMALDGMGQGADSRAVLRDSFTDYLVAEDIPGAINIAVALAWRLADDGDRGAAIDLLDQTLASTQGQGTVPDRIQLLIDLGSLQDQDGRIDAARASFEAAVATAAALGDDLVAADAGHGLAILLGGHPTGPDDSVEALSILDECRRAYDTHGHPERAVGCDHEAAALLGRLSSWDAAAARYARALAGYRDLPPDQRDTGSWPDEVADCELNLAALSDPDARTHLTEDPRLFRSGGHAMSHA